MKYRVVIVSFSKTSPRTKLLSSVGLGSLSSYPSTRPVLYLSTVVTDSRLTVMDWLIDTQ